MRLILFDGSDCEQDCEAGLGQATSLGSAIVVGILNSRTETDWAKDTLFGGLTGLASSMAKKTGGRLR